MKKYYRIVIESAGGVKHVLSDGWEDYRECSFYQAGITDSDGDYIDANRFCWSCYIEPYYA